MQPLLKTTTGPDDELFDTEFPFTDGTHTILDMFTAFRLKEENGVKFQTAKFGKMEETEPTSTKPKAGL